jgi:metal transporter CNNM
VSLLLCNAAAYEALPIFLDRLLNPLAAILISVTAILAFGEILPQATCKRYGLHIGAYCSWLVRLIMLISFPISWPVGKLLDWLLGSDTALFQRPELRAFVSLHGEGDQDGGESVLSAGEVQVIHGAMDMAHKTAETAMTPLSNVFSVDADAVLSRKLLNRIVHAGHSRVPVYEHGDRKNIIGLILVKELLLADTNKEQRVRGCLVRDVDYIRADTPLYTVMELFRMKRRHMAVLTRAPDENDQSTPHQLDVIGIITIEDVIEELLHFEIVDETDVYIDNLQTAPVATHPWRDVPPELAKYILLTRHKRLPNLSREERSFSKNLQGVVSSRCGPGAVIAVASYHTEMVSLKAGRSKSAGLLDESNFNGLGLGSETSSEMELRPESSTARPGSDVR